MKKLILFGLFLSGLFITGCQKELSFEVGNQPAEGSLQDDGLGDCLPKTVNGTYAAGQALTGTTHFITVNINVTKSGTYVVGTDTVNGYFFRTTGTFTTLGINTVTLRGNGTPFAPGINNFVVSFDSTYCDVQVTVTAPAVFTLDGAPNACTAAVVAGAYAQGVALTAANTATLNVNVTTAGAFSISTTYQGMTFAASGNFTITGPQTVQLTGSGTPTTTGANVVPVTVGTSTCNFTVNVVTPGAGTLGGAPAACTPATVNGTYFAQTPLGTSNTVSIQVNVTTAGAFNITTNTVNGYSFSYSGNIAATGPQTVILNGTGIPLAEGTNVFTVTLGSSTCTFSVTVVPADYFPRTVNSNWSYESDDDPADSINRYVITPTHSAAGNTFSIFMFNDGSGPDSSGYYRRNGGDYFEWFDAGAFIGFDDPLWAEYTFLKDNVPLNTNWKSASFAGMISATPLTLRFSYTIKLKDGPLNFTTSAGPMNFANVIAVEEKYEAEVTPGVWQDLTDLGIGYYKSYYARGIGLVLLEFYPDNAASSPDYKMELRRYQIQ